MKTDKNGKIHI